MVYGALNLMKGIFMENLKVGGAAILAHGRYSPTYNITSIDEVKKTAICVWFDTQSRKTITEEIPLNVLKPS